MLPIKFQDNRSFVSGEEAKITFSRWLLDTNYPDGPTKFHINWPFSSGEEAKNRF